MSNERDDIDECPACGGVKWEYENVCAHCRIFKEAADRRAAEREVRRVEREKDARRRRYFGID